MNTLRNLAKSVSVDVFAKQFILTESPKSLKFFRTFILKPLWSHFTKIAHKVAKSKYFVDI